MNKTILRTLLAIPALLAIPIQSAQAYCWSELVCQQVCDSDFECGWNYTGSGGSYECELVYDCYDECEYVEYCEDDDYGGDGGGGDGGPDPDPDPDPDPVGYMECTTTQVYFGSQGTFPPPVGMIVALCTNVCQVYCDGVQTETIYNGEHVCEDWECYNPYGSGGCQETFPVDPGGACG